MLMLFFPLKLNSTCSAFWVTGMTVHAWPWVVTSVFSVSSFQIYLRHEHVAVVILFITSKVFFFNAWHFWYEPYFILYKPRLSVLLSVWGASWVVELPCSFAAWRRTPRWCISGWAMAWWPPTPPWTSETWAADSTANADSKREKRAKEMNTPAWSF